MYELGQKEERAPYGRVEESLGARSSHTARRRPLILHTEEAEAPHATRFSNARQKNRPENCGNVIEVDQTAPLIHFMHGL